MPLPITALGLSTPLAGDPDQLFAIACGDAAAPAHTSQGRAAAFEQVAQAVSQATQRWGAHRVGVVVAAEPSDATSARLDEAVAFSGACGPAVLHVGSSLAGAAALGAAERWVEQDIVDAVMVRAIGGSPSQGSSEGWLLLERQGNSEVRLTSVASARPSRADGWRISPLTESASTGLTGLTGLGAATAHAYAAVAMLSIVSGHRPDESGTGRRAVETDTVICDFGPVSFKVEVAPS